MQSRLFIRLHIMKTARIHIYIKFKLCIMQRILDAFAYYYFHIVLNRFTHITKSYRNKLNLYDKIKTKLFRMDNFMRDMVSTTRTRLVRKRKINSHIERKKKKRRCCVSESLNIPNVKLIKKITRFFLSSVALDHFYINFFSFCFKFVTFISLSTTYNYLLWSIYMYA